MRIEPQGSKDMDAVNRNEISSPGAAFGIAAVAMTAVIIGGMSVGVLARLESDGRELRMAAPSKVIVPEVINDLAGPGGGDVAAVRGSKLSAIPCASLAPTPRCGSAAKGTRCILARVAPTMPAVGLPGPSMPERGPHGAC